MFVREDWTLFRSLNTLGQKAGVPASRIPRLVAKEVADNALDACGRCRIGHLEGCNGFWVEDDGNGIPGDDAEIAALFSIARPLTSSKILRRPSRGALGNGLRVVAGAVLATGGKLVVATRGRMLQLVPQETTGETLASRLAPWHSGGCRVEVAFGPSSPEDPGLLQWARWAIRLAEGESSYAGRSSPHWYDSESFYELCQAAKDRTVRELVAELHGCTEPKAGRIASAFKGRLARSLSREEGDQLLDQARGAARPVKPAALGRVGLLSCLPTNHVRASDYRVLGAGRSGIRATIPFAVEVWASADGEEQTSAMLFVNRSPITGELKAWTDKTELNVSGCGVTMEIPVGHKPIARRSIALYINIDTPYMPITTDGKEPNLYPFGDLIMKTIAKAVRIARRNSPPDETPQAGPRATKKEVILSNLDAGIAQASGNGQYRFAQRQLFYAIRPLFIQQVGAAPGWNYFCQVITDHENEHGDIRGMYRDPRGVIYHPHLREEIPLGTLHVEKYERPAWLFNKVLYCEKEGFFTLFKSIRWAERNDCALMTSKGFSSRAARDLIDLLAETDEECQFFCIHDADAQGTMIYQTLQEETRARGARKVKIINLGLELDEAIGMRLQSEPVEKKPGTELPVADYVPEADRFLYQLRRVELNAMTTPQFLEWLDRKFAPYKKDKDKGKLIPPDKTLRKHLEASVRGGLERRITAAVLRKAKVNERAERAMEKRAERIDETCSTLADRVREDFKSDPRQRWTRPVERIAGELASPLPRGNDNAPAGSA
jgi:hypothetical protein